MALSRRSLITKTGISTAQVFDMGGINISGGDFNLGSNIKLGNASGIITATTFSGASLDISGNADIDGTLEADAYTVDGTALNEYIADTVGAMVNSNTESGITVAYVDGDNTLDFTVGTLNQNTTGTAGGLTGTPNISCGTIAGSTGTFTGDVDIADKIVHTGDTNTAIRFPAADTITAETGGSERLRITSDGKVGINKTNPEQELHIVGDSDACVRLTCTDGGVASFQLGDASDTVIGGITLDSSDNSIQIRGNNNAERLRIESGGAILMMGASQSNAFSGGDDLVIGNVSSGTRTGMTLVSANNQDSGIYFSDGNSGSDVVRGQIVYHHDGNYLRFYTDGNERVRINPDGDMGLGGTPTHLLELFNDSDAENILMIRGADNTTEYAAMGVHSGNAVITGGGVGSTSAGLSFRTAASGTETERLLIASDGNVHINCPDNGTANAKVNIEESTNNTTNTLKLINKPSGANGKVRLAFYSETSAGQGAEPYIMSTSGTDAFGSNSANDGGFQFHTRHGGSGTDVNALEISNKGYVLQPQRPYFKANLSSGVRITSTGYAVFGAAVYNNGGHYSTSDGKFTAPIAGLYWFSARINAYDRIDFTIRVNGSDKERGQYNTDSDDVGWWSNQLTTIVEMTAGQYAQVHVNNLNQQADPGTWCTFMGYLLN